MIKVEWFYWLCGFFFFVIVFVWLWDCEDNKCFGLVVFWVILVFLFGYGSFVINKIVFVFVEGIVVFFLVVLVVCCFLGCGFIEMIIEVE